MSDTRPLITSPDTQRQKRIPPGQSETKKWPVLHYGDVPHVDLAQWNFRLWIRGTQTEWRCDWNEFKSLPWIDVHCDIHCVTRWSRLNNTFSGPSTKTVIEKLNVPLENLANKFVLIHAEAGFTTNLSIEEFLHDDCLFAIEHDHQPLTPDHGYPVRLVVPKLYFWKSAKWARGVEIMTKDEAGFWEQNGYHMHGDPWQEERHSW